MQYRQLVGSSLSVSALTVSLKADAGQQDDLDVGDVLRTAISGGVTAFELQNPTATLLETVRQCLSDWGGAAPFLALRCEVQAPDGPPWQTIARQMRTCLTALGVAHLDLLTLDCRQHRWPHPGLLTILKEAKASGRIGRVGVLAADQDIAKMPPIIDFDARLCAYSILTTAQDWRQHLGPSTRKQSIFATDWFEPELAVQRTAPAPDTFSFDYRRSLSTPPPQPYDFLHEEPDWTFEQLLLGYALAEPTVTSVIVEPSSTAHLQTLLIAADQEIPDAVLAKLDLLRFSPTGPSALVSDAIPRRTA